MPGTYISPAESGLYYLQSRYYDPKVGRFINADAYASTGQGVIGNNMFAYCNNNPVVYADSAGFAPWPTTVVINDGGYGSAAEYRVGQAHAIGYHSEITEDKISINLDETIAMINYLQYECGISLDAICSEMAEGACASYYNKCGYEFLLSDKCVTKEIYDHVEAYRWSIGQKILPNILGGGYAILTRSKTAVYTATRSTDIKISDVRDYNIYYGYSYGVLFSQAVIFNYYDGIRDIYIGTDKDPYAYRR